MTAAALMVFVAAIAVAMAAPGPAIVTLMARVLAQGGSASIGFAAGLVLGDVFWFACAVFGVAALAREAHDVMVLLKYLGAAYLVYVGVKLWRAPAQTAPRARSERRRSLWGGVLGGFSLALANPKTMMFYLALLPNLVDLAAMRSATFAALTALLLVVYSSVLALYIIGAERARRLLASPLGRRRINRAGGAVMLGTAAYIATRG